MNLDLTSSFIYSEKFGLEFELECSDLEGSTEDLYLVRFYSQTEAELNNLTSIDKYNLLSYAVVSSVTISNTTSETKEYTIYDSSTRYKSALFYGYGLFTLTEETEESETVALKELKSNFIVSKVTAESGTELDDLYIEDDVTRIIDAQNSASAKTITTKTFKSVNEGGGNVYSIILLTTKELVKDTTSNTPTAELTSLIEKLKPTVFKQTTGTVSTDLYQLSGIGKIESTYIQYKPVISSTIKMTVSK